MSDLRYYNTQKLPNEPRSGSKPPQAVKTLKFKDNFNNKDTLIKISSSNNDLEPSNMFSATFIPSLAKNSLAKNSVAKNSEKLTSRQSRLNQLSQRSSCKEFKTCLQQERYEYMKNKVIYQPRNIEYVLAPNQKPIKYRYGGFHKTMKSFHRESYRNAIKKHKIVQNPPKYQAISRSNNTTNTLQATLETNNQRRQIAKSKPQKREVSGKKREVSGSPKAQMLKELENWKASAQKRSAASSIVFEGIQGKSMNLNLNAIQNIQGQQYQDFKTLLSTKSQQMSDVMMQNHGVNNLQLLSFTNRIVSDDETDQVTPLIQTTGGHTGGDKSAESGTTKLFPKLISPVELAQEGLATDDISMKNFTDELNQKPIQVLLTNNHSSANQQVHSAQSGNPNLTDQDKQLIINMGEELESMNSKFSNSKTGSMSKNSPIQKKYKNAIRFENIRQSSKLKPETDSKISQKSPDNIVIIKSNKMDGPSTRLQNMINNPVTQSIDDPAKLLKQGNDELVQSVLDDTFRSNSCQKMIARDMEDEEEGTAQHIDLLAGEGTKELEEEVRDHQVASLNDYNLNREGTSVTDHSRSLRSRKVSVNSRGDQLKSKQSFQQQTMSRGEMSKLLKDPHLKVNIDLNQNNGVGRTLRRNKSQKRTWNFLQPNIQNLNFEDISSPLPKKGERPKTGTIRTSNDPQEPEMSLIQGYMVSTNYKCFPQKSPVSKSQPNMKKPFVPTNAHAKSFMRFENAEEVPKNYLSDMMIQSNSIYHAQIYQREKAELLLKQKRFQKQAEDALKQLCKATGTDMATFNRNMDKAAIDGALGTLEGSLSPASHGRATSQIKSDMAMLMDQVGWDAQVLTLLEQNQDSQVVSYIEQNKDQFGTLHMIDTNRNSDAERRDSLRNQQQLGIPSPFVQDIDSQEDKPMIYISNDSQQQSINQLRKNAFLKSSAISPNADQTYTSDSQQNPLQSPKGNFFSSMERKQHLQDTQFVHHDERNSTDECNDTKGGLDLYQQHTSGDNINLAPKLLQNLDSRLNITQQEKAKGTKTQQDRYQSAGQLPRNASKERKSHQSGMSRPFSKRSNAQFSNTNLSERERQAQYTRRNIPCLAIRPQQIPVPKQIGQSVKNLDKLQKRRALISHRDVIDSMQYNPGKYMTTVQKSETFRSSMNNRNTQINQSSKASISQTRQQTDNPKSQITMVENNFLSNDGSMVNIIATQRTAKSPKTARPFTAKEDRQQFQKQRMMTARQKVIDSRYKQRQALFMNKHNTQLKTQMILAHTNTPMNQQPQSAEQKEGQPNMQKQISMKQLKESISQNFLKHVPQSPLKYFNQENNSQIDDAVRRSNARYGQKQMGQRAKLLFNKVGDEQGSDLNYFQYGQFSRRQSARTNNKDMDVIIPNDGMASAMKKLGTLKAESNGSHSRDQSKIYIPAKSQRNFGPQQLASSQFMQSEDRRQEMTQQDTNMPEQSIYLKTGNRQYEQDFRDLNKSLEQKTIIPKSNSKHAIQPILDYNNQKASGQRSGQSNEVAELSSVEETNMHLSPNMLKEKANHSQMSGQGIVIDEHGGDQVKIMSSGRKRVAMSKLGIRSSQHVSNANLKVSSSFQNPPDGENKFAQLKEQALILNEPAPGQMMRKKKSITHVNMANIDNQKDEEYIYGQHTLRDTGTKNSGPATLVHEIESPVVINDPDEQSPLKLYNPAF